MPRHKLSPHPGDARRAAAPHVHWEHVTEPDDSPRMDRLVHEPLRLALVSALAARESMTFTELRALLKTSDGNLSVHARKLEEAGYLECAKGFEGRKPRTEFRLTPAGRRALERYLSHMEALILAARKG